MGVSRAAVLAKAAEWVGMMERTGSNDIWFADDWGITGQAWCFAFVQSCFWYADPNQNASHSAGALPHQSMYCPYGIQWARDNGQAIEVGGAPIPGDIVFFSWDMGTWGRWTPGTGDHVGLVEGWDGGDIVHTIEGNISPAGGGPQGVWRRSRSISETVICFWRPAIYDDSLGPAALPPEDDMFEQSDRDKVDQLLAAAVKASAANAVSFVQDPRDGAVYLVWGTMFRRYINSPESLANFQVHWAARGGDINIYTWSPSDLDPIPRIDLLPPQPEPEPSTIPPPPVPRPDLPTDTDPNTPPVSTPDEAALAVRVAQLETNVTRILQILEAFKPAA